VEDPILSVPSIFRIGEYEALSELGRGGAGIVYRARHGRLDREVALKVLLSGPFADASSRERFLREARAGAELDHRNIVPVFSLGEEDGRLFCAMRWIRGGSLADALAKDPKAFAPRRAAVLILQVARGVGHAHQRGILHRDLKPSNILLEDEDHPRIADFGLAYRLDGPNELTHSGLALGTPAYMAPEQGFGSGDVTTATDIWGIGAILYQLLAGRPPFLAATAMALARAVAEDDPTPPLAVRSRLDKTRRRIPARVFDRDLETICLKCLAKSPTSRYPTAEALADDLERCLRGHPILARPVGPLERGQRWCQRRPRIAILVALLFLVLGVMGVGGPLLALRVSRARNDAVNAHARTQHTLDRLEAFAIAERTAKNGPADGLALVARRLRQHPNSVSDAERALALLARHRFAVPEETVRSRLHQSAHSYSRDHRWWGAYDPSLGGAAIWDILDGRLLTVRSWSNAPPQGTIMIEASANFLALSVGGEGIEVLRLADGIRQARLDWPIQRHIILRFSPDGRWLAATGGTEETPVWSVENWELAASFPNDPTSLDLLNPGPLVQAIEFSPDGSRLAVGSFGGLVKVYEIPEGTHLASWQHRSPVVRLAFSADGDVVASASADSVRIWDLQSQRPLGEWNMHESTIDDLIFTPDDRFLAVGTGAGHMYRWNFRDRTFPDPPVVLPEPGVSLARSRPSWIALVLSANAGACWFDLEEQRVLAELPGLPDGGEFVLHPTGGGHAVLVRGATGDVRAWVVPEFNPGEHRLSHNSEVVSTRFGHAGTVLATVAWAGEVRVWNLAADRVTPGPHLSHGPRAWRARFAPDDLLLATAGWQSEVHLWNPKSGDPISTFDHPDSAPWWIDFTLDGSRLLTAGGWTGDESEATPGAIQAWDLAQGSTVFRVGTERFVWEPVLSPDGQRWVVPDRSSLPLGHPSGTPATLRVIRTDNGADALPPLSIAERDGAPAQINSTDYSRDGRWIAAGGIHHVCVWDARDGRLVWDLPHRQRVRSVRFHPDSRRFLTAGEDGTARLWDLGTGRPLTSAHVMRHDLGNPNSLFEGTGIKGAEFSPDGRWIATGGADCSARLWDAETGLPIAEPMRHDGPVFSVEFGPDGRWLVTGSADKTARLWRLFPAREPAPDWLPDFIEALVRRRLGPDDQPRPVGIDAFFEARRVARLDPPKGIWAEVLRPYLDTDFSTALPARNTASAPFSVSRNP
jgi:WD40 repeat protein